jgi:hypothetical protein
MELGMNDLARCDYNSSVFSPPLLIRTCSPQPAEAPYACDRKVSCSRNFLPWVRFRSFDRVAAAPTFVRDGIDG